MFLMADVYFNFTMQNYGSKDIYNNSKYTINLEKEQRNICRENHSIVTSHSSIIACKRRASR